MLLCPGPRLPQASLLRLLSTISDCPASSGTSQEVQDSRKGAAVGARDVPSQGSQEAGEGSAPHKEEAPHTELRVPQPWLASCPPRHPVSKRGDCETEGGKSQAKSKHTVSGPPGRD